MAINSRKKVFVLVGSLKIGGAERMALNVASNLDQSKFDVFLVLQNDIVELPNKMNRDRLIFLRKKKYENLFYKIYDIFFRYFFVTIKHRPDVVIAFTRFSSFLATFSFCSKIIGRFDMDPLAAKRYRRMANWTFRWPFVKKIVVPSTGLYNAIRQKKPDENKLLVIPNNIDSRKVRAQASKNTSFDLEKLNNRPYISAMGRFARQKNFSLLLKAYKSSKISNSLALVILGDGKEMENVKQEIKNLDLTNDVYLPGMVHNPFPVIANSSIFINTSRKESFCNVILEALTIGKLVIATDCPHGPADMISNGKNGYLIPNEDKNALTEILDKYFVGTLFRPKQSAINDSIKRFDLSAVIKQWETLIESLL